jgi:hypothetical protein
LLKVIYIYRDRVDKGKYKQNIKEELENSKYMYMYLKLEKPYGVEQSVTSSIKTRGGSRISS